MKYFDDSKLIPENRELKIAQENESRMRHGLPLHPRPEDDWMAQDYTPSKDIITIGEFVDDWRSKLDRLYHTRTFMTLTVEGGRAAFLVHPDQLIKWCEMEQLDPPPPPPAHGGEEPGA